MGCGLYYNYFLTVASGFFVRSPIFELADAHTYVFLYISLSQYFRVLFLYKLRVVGVFPVRRAQPSGAELQQSVPGSLFPRSLTLLSLSGLAWSIHGYLLGFDFFSSYFHLSGGEGEAPVLRNSRSFFCSFRGDFRFRTIASGIVFFYQAFLFSHAIVVLPLAMRYLSRVFYSDFADFRVLFSLVSHVARWLTAFSLPWVEWTFFFACLFLTVGVPPSLVLPSTHPGVLSPTLPHCRYFMSSLLLISCFRFRSLVHFVWFGLSDFFSLQVSRSCNRTASGAEGSASVLPLFSFSAYRMTGGGG